jgi:hypothetical protein
MILLRFNYQGIKEGKNDQPYKNDNLLECQSESTNTSYLDSWGMDDGWMGNKFSIGFLVPLLTIVVKVSLQPTNNSIAP